MINLWNEKDTKNIQNDPLALRVYSSRLLGSNQSLVLHGGGNTSVKIGKYLYVKGSGWDLATIEKEGFPAVSLTTLKEMATMPSLSDTAMVQGQRDAMKDPSFPNPSVEAILHAIIPFDFVDHTHADAVVTLSNTQKGKEILQEVYGDTMLIIDYIMPGFILAQKIYEETRAIDWTRLEGIILLNHGIFTFDDDAHKSYDKMIAQVSKAEAYLTKHAPINTPKHQSQTQEPQPLQRVAKLLETLRKSAIDIQRIDTDQADYFASLPNLHALLHQGPLTPEHVIRTKAFGMYVEEDAETGLEQFKKDYLHYFEAYATDEVMLDLAPRWIVVQNRGVYVCGKDTKENKILTDIISHTIHAILQAEALGGWQSLTKDEIFEMEYWELEQAKLKKV